LEDLDNIESLKKGSIRSYTTENTALIKASKQLKSNHLHLLNHSSQRPMLPLSSSLHTARNSSGTTLNSLRHVFDTITDWLSCLACHSINGLSYTASCCADDSADRVGHAGNEVSGEG
jgi:hypothetical protein